jgi:hypothetical protein
MRGIALQEIVEQSSELLAERLIELIRPRALLKISLSSRHFLRITREELEKVTERVAHQRYHWLTLPHQSLPLNRLFQDFICGVRGVSVCVSHSAAED